MKNNSHIKKQIAGVVSLVLVFVLTVLYSSGYFDLTFITRPQDQLGSMVSPPLETEEETEEFIEETDPEEIYEEETPSDPEEDYEEDYEEDEEYYEEEEIYPESTFDMEAFENEFNNQFQDFFPNLG